MPRPPLSLDSLEDGPRPSLEEALTRSRRLISKRTDIIREVEFRKHQPGDPSVYWAVSRPGSTTPLFGRDALALGNGVAPDPARAQMKAIGESIERYCAAAYDERELQRAAARELGARAVSPGDFALFSAGQYASPRFPYRPFTGETVARWTPGTSLTEDRTVLLPAASTFLPYVCAGPDEPPVIRPSSIGLACGTTLASAIYRAALEVIERDAFMIVWLNRLERPRIDLGTVDDPCAQSLIAQLKRLPVEFQARLLTLDIRVPVVLVILTAESGPPYTVVGASADLDPLRALTGAIEESLYVWMGMVRAVPEHQDFDPGPDYINVDSTFRHGLVHATCPELRRSLGFLVAPGSSVPLSELVEASASGSAWATQKVRALARLVSQAGCELVVADLTTPDVDDAGFKVVRAVAPGLQPFDAQHRCRHLGGRRVYEVPVQLGLAARPARESELNPLPHPFP